MWSHREMGISWLKATFYEVMGNGSFGDFDACARRTRSFTSQISRYLWQRRISQPQSITQKGAHTNRLTARERDHWLLQRLAISSCEFRASIARTPFCAILWRSPKNGEKFTPHFRRKGLSPEFRATRLLARNSRRASLEIFCLFSCV